MEWIWDEKPKKKIAVRKNLLGYTIELDVPKLRKRSK